MFGYYLEFGAWNLVIYLNVDHSLLDIECSFSCRMLDIESLTHFIGKQLCPALSLF
jgi:hypothetical protein